jgi:hypothetical protein
MRSVGRASVVVIDRLFLDYSKHRLTDETLSLLVDLAEQSGLRERIDAMLSGEHINVTEDRGVLHVALGVPREASVGVDGTDVVPESTRCSTGWYATWTPRKRCSSSPPRRSRPSRR